MNRLTIFLVGIITACSNINLFQNPQENTLLTVADEPVYIDEFLYAFNKNRNLDSAVSKEEVDNYLELYINFKLKVAEAKTRGLDKTTEFNKEYSSYISQLDNSYLQANNDSDILVAEAYERLQHEISASHILFNLSESSLPEDTLLVYNKAITVRDSIINGASFEKMAKEYSQDPSAIKNFGNLGYFTVFAMVYPFETAAYNTNIGGISMPVRSKFGYHLIKVNDKRPNQGRVKVAHIMIRKNDRAKEKAFRIYDQLVAGGNWDQLCEQNSDDAQSASKAGELPPFGKTQIVAEFAQVAFSLKEVNEISDPVQTAYGWHIIKLIEKLPVGDFQVNENQLRAKVKRDSRSQLSKKRMIERLAIDNNFQENKKNVQSIILPDSHHFLKGKWIFANDTLADLQLFSISDTKYFAKNYYESIDKSGKQLNSKDYLYDKYKKYKEEELINYEKAHLSDKYVDYKYLQQEYYDGILLFSIMEDEVWSRAGEDSIGLEGYYNMHIDEFVDTTRIMAAIFSAKDPDIINDVAQQIAGIEQYKNLSPVEKLDILSHYNDIRPLSLQFDNGEFVIKEHLVLQNLSLPYKPTILNVNDKWHYVLPLSDSSSPLPLKEVRGKIIAGYQLTLEKRWLENLKKKYPVVIKKSALKKIYKEFEIQ